MSKFNKTKQTIAQKTETTNYAGGQAYQQSSKLEFASILLTSFVQNQYYRTEDETLTRLKELMCKVDPVFAAKAAIYARDSFNMRSITHVVAGELIHTHRGMPGIRNFLKNVVIRPDDMSEILSYYESNYGSEKVRKNNKTWLPTCVKKAFRECFDKWDEYQLGKRQMSGKEWSLVDIVNVVRPIPTDKNAEALRKLVSGELKADNTVSQALANVGQVAKENNLTEEQKNELKNEAWRELINSGNIPYMNLIMNLRNIVQQAPDTIDKVCSLLTNSKAIKKSRMLPFRFYTAYLELSKIGCPPKLISALSTACELALDNVPNLENTLVAVDLSGSMGAYISDKSIMSMKQIGAFIGAILVKRSKADVMAFATGAKYVNYNPSDSIFTITDSILKVNIGYGTDFHLIFDKANRKYDRFIIISDMQAWIGYYSPAGSYHEYCKNYKNKPVVYSFDLNGYGTLQLPENNVYCLAGFSDKVFDIMSMLESDKDALVREIEKIEF